MHLHILHIAMMNGVTLQRTPKVLRSVAIQLIIYVNFVQLPLFLIAKPQVVFYNQGKR